MPFSPVHSALKLKKSGVGTDESSNGDKVGVRARTFHRFSEPCH